MSYEQFNFFHRRRIETSKCPPVPDLPPEQVGSESGKILQAMGARSCKTDGSVFQAEVQAKANALVVSTSVGAKTSLAKTSAIGCEQIAAITNKYNKAVQNVACIINSSHNVTSTDVKGVQSVVFSATPILGDPNSGNLEIDCPEGFNIDQNMVLKMVSKVNLSDDEIAQITSECNDVIKTAVDAVQNSTSGIAATPQGSKAISDTLANINTVDQKNQVKETIKEINTSMSGSQIVSMTGKNVRISGKGCEIKQTMLIDLIAEQIVRDTVTTGLTTINKSVMETETKMSQTAKNLGAEELGLKLDNPGAISKWAYIIIGVVLLVLVLGVVFVVNKRSGQLVDKVPQISQDQVNQMLSRIPQQGGGGFNPGMYGGGGFNQGMYGHHVKYF